MYRDHFYQSFYFRVLDAILKASSFIMAYFVVGLGCSANEVLFTNLKLSFLNLFTSSF